MMAEEVRRFQDHRASELVSSSSGSREHKRLGQGVRNFDYATRDRSREGAVPAGMLAKIAQKPGHKITPSEH